MSECGTFVKLICKCGCTAGSHVSVGDALAGCETCGACVVFVAAVLPDPEVERIVRWQAEKETRGALLADVPAPERRYPSERDDGSQGGAGEEGRHVREGAQPGSPDLFSPTYWRPSPVRRGHGTPAAY